MESCEEIILMTALSPTVMSSADTEILTLSLTEVELSMTVPLSSLTFKTLNVVEFVALLNLSSPAKLTTTVYSPTAKFEILTLDSPLLTFSQWSLWNYPLQHYSPE